MTERKGSASRVLDFFHKTRGTLKLTPVLKAAGLSRRIVLSGSQKDSSPVQVWGKKEWKDFLGVPQHRRSQWLRERWKGVAAVVFAAGTSVPESILQEAERRKVSLFQAEVTISQCRHEVRRFVATLPGQRMIIPGGLLWMFGLGVLIVGDSGVGKSESALELISRGYRFISDDVTLVERRADGRLTGKAPALSRNFMEVRGLGIIHIGRIFGTKAVRRLASVDLVIRLKRWEEGRDYDRLGLGIPEDFEILGVKIPQISIPVAPGRNISTLIEVACKVHNSRLKGHHAPEEIVKRLDRALSIG